MFDAKSHQATRQTVDLFPELVPGQTVVTVGIDKRVILAAAGNGLVKQLPERILVRHGQVVPGDTGRHALTERRFGGSRSKRIGQLELRHVPFLCFLCM